LNIGDTDNRPSLETVLTTARFYGLTEEHAKQIIEEIATDVDGWENAAKKAGISRGDLKLMSAAFSAQADYRR
jgi:serine/threonine-protein kinase HipA